MFLVLHVLRITHSSDVGPHGQQVEEGEELNSEDGVNLRGRQHQHSQRQQHLGITLQPPAAVPLTHKHTHTQMTTHTGLQWKRFPPSVVLTPGKDTKVTP